MHEETNETTTEEQKFRLLEVTSDQDAMLLRKESEPVSFVIADNSGQSYLDNDTRELIQALKDYIIEHDGLGMAAVQLGVHKRVIVMRKPFSSDRLVVMINPKLLRGTGKSTKGEGCFSIKLPGGTLARVERMSQIFVEFQDEQGETHTDEMLIGMDARIFQHELDHLNGYLMIDEKTPTGRFRGWQRAF